MKKYEKYKNRDWLYWEYWICQNILSDIAKKIGCAKNAIWRWMEELNISKRSLSKARHLSKRNHCQLSKEAVEFIEGELLGDGCLQSYSKYSAKFSYSSKYREYINYISSTLNFRGIKQAGKINKRKTDTWTTYYYISLSYIELLKLQKKWYPNGKKIVPKDIELTPITCRQWYIGDGSLIKPKNGNPYITLATCGFLKSDVEWLVEQLNKLGFKTTRQSSHNDIRISTHSTPDLFNYIGECPCKVYDYKWNLKKEI